MARPRRYERLSLWAPPALCRFLDAASAASGMDKSRLAGCMLLIGCAAQARTDGDAAMAKQLQAMAEELFRRGDLD